MVAANLLALVCLDSAIFYKTVMANCRMVWPDNHTMLAW